MSDSDDLELEALQRQLDDAFETTRPRAGFEDELWTRMQAARPAGTRLRDAWAGLIQGIRAVPAVPTAAVAALLVVIIGAGALALSGAHFGGNSATSGTTGLQAPAAGQDRYAAPGAFGKLPSPALNNGTKQSVGGPTQPSTILGAENVFWILPNVAGFEMSIEPAWIAKFGWLRTLKASMRSVK